MDYDKLLCKIFFKDDWHFNRNYVARYNRAYKSRKRLKNIIDYIETRYTDSTKLKEVLYRIKYNIDTKPVCKTCGAPVEFIGKNGVLYRQYCSNTCAGKNKETINKKKQTQLKHWGTENCYDSEKYKQQYKEKHGVEYTWERKDVKEKRIQKLIEHFGSVHDAAVNIGKKSIETYKQNTGYENPMCNPDVVQKRINTLKENGSFNSSKDEKIIKDLFVQIFGEDNVLTQYSSDKYPFACDFYIKSLDLYVEYNGTWTHNTHAFDTNNEKDVEQVNIWKSKNTKFYEKAVYVWTDLDVRKRNTAANNKLKFLELWDMNDVYAFVELWTCDLQLCLSNDTLWHDFDYFKIHCGKLSNLTYLNNIVKHFQFNSFYINELKLWRNTNIKLRLILNRIKYLNKHISNITHHDLLTGFKKSGIYYGYSHFNPLLIKWFHENFNSHICYDPCGGWGHRILGSLNIDKYIYNDLSTTVANNCETMVQYFGIQNVEIHNKDANTFMPDDDFDTMFTCPPYFNIEKYECDNYCGFENIDEYNKLLDNIFKVFNEKKSCKTLGIVLLDNLLDKTKHVPTHTYELPTKFPNHLISKKQNKEYLFVFHK